MTIDQLNLITSLYDFLLGARIIGELKTGLSNNYVLESQGTKYFLKQYRYADLEKVKEIHLVKKYLSDGGIPIIQPLSRVTGETIAVVDGVMYAIFPFVTGYHQLQGNVSDSALDSMAQMLAKIHKVSLNRQLVIGEAFKEWNRDNFLEKATAILRVIEHKKELTELDVQMKELILVKRELM